MRATGSSPLRLWINLGCRDEAHLAGAIPAYLNVSGPGLLHTKKTSGVNRSSKGKDAGRGLYVGSSPARFSPHWERKRSQRLIPDANYWR